MALGPIIVSHASAGRGPGPVRGPVSRGPVRGPVSRSPVSPSLAAAAAKAGTDPVTYQQALGLVNAQTQGPLTELAQQLANNQKTTAAQTQLAGGYFNQFGDLAKQGAQNAQNLAGGLNSTLSGIAGQENQALQQSGQGQLDALAKYTPPGGDSSLGMQALQSQLARQQGLAAQDQGTFRAYGATMGNNAAQLANSNLGVGALAGTQALKGISQAGLLRGEPITSKQAALEASKGALLATDINKIGQQNVADRIAEAGLGIKQGSLQLTAAQDAARNRLTAMGITSANQRSANSLAVTRQNDLANQALRAAQLSQRAGYDSQSLALKQAALNLRSGRGGAKPLTTSQQNTIYRNLDEMMTLIGAAQKAGHSEADIRQALQTGSLQKGLPAQSAVLVQAAYELLGWGHITPPVARAMHAMGLRGGTFRGQPIKVGPAPSGGGNFQGLGAGLQNLGNAVGAAISGA